MLIDVPGVMPALRLGMPPTGPCLPTSSSRESMAPVRLPIPRTPLAQQMARFDALLRLQSGDSLDCYQFP